MILIKVDLILKDQSMYLCSFLLDKNLNSKDINWFAGDNTTTSEYLLNAYSVTATIPNALCLCTL